MHLRLIQHLPRRRLPVLALKSYPYHRSFLNSQKNTKKSSNPFYKLIMAPKRKRSIATVPLESTSSPAPILPLENSGRPAISRRTSKRTKVDTNPDHNVDIVDGPAALRASPDADEEGESLDIGKLTNGTPVTPAKVNGIKTENGLQDGGVESTESSKKPKKTPTKSSISAKKGSDEIKAFKAEQAEKKAAAVKVKKEDDDEWDSRQDPDGDEAAPAEDADAVKLEGRRPPPVNSDYLPLPWKGRLGYACLNTYLRMSDPPIFTSRTCRIASILEHRHPLKDPSQPEHATKNRPDKSQPESIERGQRYVEELALANVRDIPKMLRWNDKYGIKFLRLSSEMFPFASHAEYGYKLAPFASEALAEVGKVATKLGHRMSTHPGQFTQLGSPRAEVIANAVRDLEYHDEMLSLLKLPPQEDRDAVMILHMGGTFGDKEATLDRFRENYHKLSPSIKQRLVLENDDVSWSVHDLLPVCEELNIPLCLDFHHHNIIFDSSQLREGTKDITTLFPRIKATWDRKQIRQKMHYSEPCPEAITGRQRRKHNPRPATLPPCPNDMDLMIEAKDKEQAVFELMLTFKLPGWEAINPIVPYERDDDNRAAPRKAKKKKTKKQIAAEIEEFGRELSEEEEEAKALVPDEEIGMGGKENRVYWPVGMEEWLRPRKRVVKPKAGAAGGGGGGVGEEEEMFKNPTPANFAARKAIEARRKAPLSDEALAKLHKSKNLGDLLAVVNEVKGQQASTAENGKATVAMKATARTGTPKKKSTPAKKKKVVTPNIDGTEEDEEEEEELSMPDLSDEDEERGNALKRTRTVAPARQSGRALARKRMSYAEGGDEDED